MKKKRWGYGDEWEEDDRHKNEGRVERKRRGERRES